jgi:quinol monooxygenase YgiN
MAILVLFEAAGVTQAKYDQVSSEVMPGNKPTDGLLYHVAAPTADGFRVVEVWESQAAMDKFFEATLQQALQKAEINVQPTIATVHNIIKP